MDLTQHRQKGVLPSSGRINQLNISRLSDVYSWPTESFWINAKHAAIVVHTSYFEIDRYSALNVEPINLPLE